MIKFYHNSILWIIQGEPGVPGYQGAKGEFGTPGLPGFQGESHIETLFIHRWNDAYIIVLYFYYLIYAAYDNTEIENMKKYSTYSALFYAGQ